MKLTGREIVKSTLEFQSPDRIAHSFPPSDLVCHGIVIPNPETEWKQISDKYWVRKDEWGNQWARVKPTGMGEVVKGGIKDLNQLDEYQFPDFSNPAYYEEAKRLFDAHPDQWHIGGLKGFEFNIARYLRKIEYYLQDLVLEREKIHWLHDRIDEIIEIQIIRLKEIGADSVMVWEDWGTQTQLLINPELWRQEFKPRIRKISEFAHSLDLKVFMHSCGKMTDIVPDLIESGIDLFQFDQPRIHGLDYLSQLQDQFQITYWSPVDIQSVLPNRDEMMIRAEARIMLDQLWKGRGGFIAGYYEDYITLGLDRIHQEYASDEFIKHGKGENY